MDVNIGNTTKHSLSNDIIVNEQAAKGCTEKLVLQHLLSPESITTAPGDEESEYAVTIALIDYRTLTRDSFSHMLTTCADDLKILSYATHEDFLADQPDRYKGIGIIVLSVGSGAFTEQRIYENMREIEEVCPDTPIAVLCDHVEVASIVEAYQHGIRGYIPTELPPCVVVGALRLIQTGGTFMPPNHLVRALEKQSVLPKVPNFGDGSSMFCALTPRQRDVLELLRQGKANKAIAFDLGVEESTVKVHVRQIMKKLNVTNRTHAALLAQQQCDPQT